MLLQILIVGAVALIVFGYARLTRRARLQWLVKLDLPGMWRSEAGEFSLTLSGERNKGRFVMTREGIERSGRWQLKGHLLTLVGAAGEEADVYDLTFFKPGNIGLTTPAGERLVLFKEATNVIRLPRGSRRRDE